MNKPIFILALLILPFTGCSQEQAEGKKVVTKEAKEKLNGLDSYNISEDIELSDSSISEIDFLKYISDVRGFTTGLIAFDNYFNQMGNNIGSVRGIIIYSQGLAGWNDYLEKKFPNLDYPSTEVSLDLLVADSILFKEFDMYAFFLDKKYLKKLVEVAENGEFVSYYPEYPVEYTLYERKAGNATWRKIGSKSFANQEDDDWWKPESSDFIRWLIKKSP